MHHYLVFVVTQRRDGNEFNIEIDDTLARKQEQSRYLELQYSLCMEYKSVVENSIFYIKIYFWLQEKNSATIYMTNL